MKLQCVLSNRLTLVVIDLINYLCVCVFAVRVSIFSELCFFLLLLPSLTNSREGESPEVEYLFNLLLLRVLACWKTQTIKKTQECSILPWSGEQTNSAFQWWCWFNFTDFFLIFLMLLLFVVPAEVFVWLEINRGLHSLRDCCN